MNIRILVVLCWTSINTNCQLIVHDTDRTSSEHLLQFDCLYYHITREELAYQDLSNRMTDIIAYCFRPLNRSEKRLGHLANVNEQGLTFEELRRRNVSTTDLLSWSCPIGLAEKYELYLNTLAASLSDELFYNCTKPWFGLHCQYSFEFTERMSIDDVVHDQFHRKVSYSEAAGAPKQFPCYVHIPCHRGGSALCLDWREICDGHIDCLDEGLDELFCFEMERHACAENEYRCHNGLCIPRQFWDNGAGHADCLDRSDEYADVAYPTSCFHDPTFRCEEHSCRANWHEFPCGDGQCVQTFDQCHNGRHWLLIESLLTQGNLSDRCFVAMICLTKLVNEVSGFACDGLMQTVAAFLRSCESIFQFPSVPVHSGHIRFLYENMSSKTNHSLSIIPDYICYDQELCDCLLPTFLYQNLTCITSARADLMSSVTGHVWLDMILAIDSYFRSCMTSRPLVHDPLRYANTSSLYQCRNSSKMISKHRIMDENLDCCLGDDEDDANEYNCPVNIPYRIRCSGEKKCLSSLHTQDDCLLNENNFAKKFLFKNICDGLAEIIFTDSTTGHVHTDESDCHYWPCKNIYTTCDGYWTCPSGEDEERCFPTTCPTGTYSCLSPVNHSFVCLPLERVNDGVRDCLGSMDEMEFCRRVYPSHINPKRFRCENTDVCLSLTELCDHAQSCPLGDDEVFCQHHSFFEETLRPLDELQRNQITHFSLHRAVEYPPLESHQTVQWVTEQYSLREHHPSEKTSNLSPWSCNRGLTVRMRLTKEYRCLCPPSYYGDACEYQNERVSLTLGIVRAERDEVYTILIMLIYTDSSTARDTQAYELVEYIPSQSCDMKYNLYLLYSRRPKHLSGAYFIHTDIYEKYTMNYRGSWYFPVPFLFLPVNRISALLFIPSAPLPVVADCSIQCQNGQCVRYVNREERTFCRCFPGWSGYHCDTPMDCTDCSANSLCIESINNRSICLCPLMKFGVRCLVPSFCPENACENNGQCVSADPMSLSNRRYSCICSDQYYGTRCQHPKAKLDISLQHLPIPSFLLAFFFTVSDHSEPTLTIMIQKLTLFQRSVTFRISIPYHIVLVRSNRKSYLAVVHSHPSLQTSTQIHPSSECFPIELLFNSTMLTISHFQRIKYYHLLCHIHPDLHCFLDQAYLCFCTIDRHANCFPFTFNENDLQCSAKHVCFNGGQCLQDHPTCPSTVVCVCTDCFYGNQCQFYSKGLGLTLDEILMYEIRHEASLAKQSLAIKISALITTVLFLAGVLNSVLSIFVFKNKTAQEVGCGIYLFVSSIISLCIVIVFTLKFGLLIYSYQDRVAHKFVRFSNCMIVEPLLKLLVNVNNWLTACVAGERAFAVFKGVSFRKTASRRTARWVIICVLVFNIILLTPQALNLHLFYDRKEERTWCVVLYSELLNSYNSFVLFFHFFSPFLINLLSALFIIIGTAHQRVLFLQNQHHFNSRLKQHQHLLISPVILLVLSLPRLLISFTLSCQKSSHYFWLYLSAYFISFLPSMLIFIVFVLPSAIYKKEFRQFLSRIQRRYALFSQNL